MLVHSFSASFVQDLDVEYRSVLTQVKTGVHSAEPVKTSSMRA